MSPGRTYSWKYAGGARWSSYIDRGRFGRLAVVGRACVGVMARIESVSTAGVEGRERNDGPGVEGPPTTFQISCRLAPKSFVVSSPNPAALCRLRCTLLPSPAPTEPLSAAPSPSGNGKAVDSSCRVGLFPRATSISDIGCSGLIMTAAPGVRGGVRVEFAVGRSKYEVTSVRFASANGECSRSGGMERG